MVCKESQELIPFELILFHAKVWHAILNDSDSWNNAQYIIEDATKRGIFDNVEILPERPKSPLLKSLGESLRPETFNDINV